MFSSTKFSSAITYSACSAVLLTMVGCSEGGSGQPAPVAQSLDQIAATETPGTQSDAPNAQNARDFTGTTRGRVSEVNADGSVVVLGQTIVVSGATVYFGVERTEIMVGDYISVEGSVDGSGQVVAGAITLDTSFDPTVSLLGVVGAVNPDEQTFQVGGVTIEFDAVNFANFDSANLSNGMVVEIVANEQNFDAVTTQVSADSISVLQNGNIINISSDGIFVNNEDGTVIVDDNNIVVSDSQNTVALNDDVNVNIDGSTTGGISIDGVDLEDSITDTVNDALDSGLELGDLLTYNYSDIRLSASSNCLSIGAPGNFQVTGQTQNSTNELVIHNLNEQVSVNSDSPNSVSLTAGDSTGIQVNMLEQDIVEVDIVAGDTTLTHYVGAIHDNVARPVVLAKQTESWCSFIVFEQDNCTSITNTVSDAATITAGQTVVDTSSAGTTITIDGEVFIDTESNQWLSDNGIVETVSSHSGVTVAGCTLNNPNDIPVITVQ